MLYYLKLLIIIYMIRTSLPVALLNELPYFDGDLNKNLANYVTNKQYVPKENILPKISVTKDVETDVIYLLSKLSDQDLLKLLNEQPSKNEYDLNDLIRIADKSELDEKNIINTERSQLLNSHIFNFQNKHKNRFHKNRNPEKNVVHNPVYRLNNKEVDPFNLKHNMESENAAVNKIKNLLYSRPQKYDSEEIGAGDAEKKEILFDVLVGQLKSLCCKTNKMKTNQNLKKSHIKSIFNEMISPNVYDTSGTLQDMYSQAPVPFTNEYIFLIVNDEIKSNKSEELVSVDPDSIENNCSVLLLGPITSSLSDSQLKLVMRRISNELLKPEYLPLLQQLSEGLLKEDNKRLIKSVVSGPDTRRYIKPHRCNHQSKLAKIYGGPKWIICTGYLNLNSPSLYDK